MEGPEEDWSSPFAEPEIKQGWANRIGNQGRDGQDQVVVPGGSGRVVIHLDLDCFYAQAEAILDPSLRDVPFGIQQKQLVITTNYVARRAGVPKSGSAAELLKRFPELRLVNGEDLKEYRRFSAQVHDILREELGPRCPVERLGLDENFADVTSLVEDRLKDPYPGFTGKLIHDGDAALVNASDPAYQRLAIGSQIAAEARERVLKETGLTCSAGVAGNKLLAKLSGGCHKPDNQTTLLPSQASELVESRCGGPDAEGGFRSIPGIGSATTAILKECGVMTLRDLQSADMGILTRRFDHEKARLLKDLSFGHDPAPVKASGRPKTIGLEDRCSRSICSVQELREKLRWLVGRLWSLVHQDGRVPATLKVTFKEGFTKDGFHKESRQCKVGPTMFQGVKSSAEASEKAVENLVDACSGLMGKSVDLRDAKFKISLLGVSVGDLSGEDKSGSKSISSFFKKAGEESPQKFPASAPSSSSTIGTQDEEDWDEEVFKALPKKLQDELLANKKAKAPATRGLATQHHGTGGTGEAGSGENDGKLPSSQKALVGVKRKSSRSSKNNSILSYFSKK